MGERHISFMSLQCWQCQDQPMNPSEEPQVPAPERSPGGPLRRVCGSTHLSWKRVPPTYLKHPRVLLGEKMLVYPIGPTYVCESTLTAPALTLHTTSPEASQSTRRVNRASASYFGSFCLSSANSLQPSWKAASLTAGRAGGWAWEAPRVSRTVPLPQPLPDPESTHMCYGVVHQETHTLSLLLEHTQAYTPIFKQSCCIKESKHTQTHGVCAYQSLDPELCTNTQINMSVSQVTQQHTHAHTGPCTTGTTQTNANPPLCRSVHQSLHVKLHEHHKTTHVCVQRDTITCTHGYRQACSRNLATEPHSHVPSPSESRTLCNRRDRL